MKKEQSIIVEDGVVAGNYYDKYETKNPIARKMMNNFEVAVFELVMLSGASSIHEVGCGEGHLAAKLKALPSVKDVRGSDFSTQVISLARKLYAAENIVFKAQSVYELDADVDSAELIICCEVLEHVEEPERALQVLQNLAAPYCLLSVPREPVWRILNMLRGKYLGDLGNTPGHIQHWSKAAFIAMAEKYFRVEAVKSPLPWTVLLCRKK